jgi:type II secretory pathway component PulF
MGIPEVIVKKKKKKSLVRRILGFDLFLDLAVLFGLLYLIPVFLIDNIFPPLGVVLPVFVNDLLLLFAFWMQLIAIALLFIFGLSLIQKLGRGRRKKTDRVRTRSLPTTPSVPPHRVEKHTEYLASSIEKAKAEQEA